MLQRGLIANFTCVAMGQPPLKIRFVNIPEVVMKLLLNGRMLEQHCFHACMSSIVGPANIVHPCLKNVVRQ